MPICIAAVADLIVGLLKNPLGSSNLAGVCGVFVTIVCGGDCSYEVRGAGL